MKLDYIVVHADDVGELRDWYVTKMGLDSLWESEAFVMLVGETGARLGVHRGAPLSDASSLHLHFQVADVAGKYRAMREKGVDFVHPPRDTDWGYRTAACFDPIGHKVEIFTPIHS